MELMLLRLSKVEVKAAALRQEARDRSSPPLTFIALKASASFKMRRPDRGKVKVAGLKASFPLRIFTN